MGKASVTLGMKEANDVIMLAENAKNIVVALATIQEHVNWISEDINAMPTVMEAKYGQIEEHNIPASN